MNLGGTMGMNNSMNMMMPYTTSMMGAGMSDMMNLNMMPYCPMTHPSMASNNNNKAVHLKGICES